MALPYRQENRAEKRMDGLICQGLAHRVCALRAVIAAVQPVLVNSRAAV